MIASELRIGNYVIGQTGELKNIPYGMPYKIESYEDLLWSDLLLPVPITEDWLVRFTFELLEKYVYCLELIKNNSLLINIKHKSCFIGIRDSDDYDREIIFPDYVHQLQNLYFALTGNELILKAWESQ